MPRGYSLHIGLNHVDPQAYNGWDGRLFGCINDANAMEAICSSRGFSTEKLIDGQATADAIIGAIGQAAHNLSPGDTFLISYSGHGSQVPDETGDSETGLDQTWVAFDRMVVDHELYNLWSQFEPGVRIEVFSDSCHSGTVIRELMSQGGKLHWPDAEPPARSWKNGQDGRWNFRQVFSKAAMSPPTRDDPGITVGEPTRTRRRPRFMPAALALQIFNRDRRMYSALQWSRRRSTIGATVILISGCQDNQESLDGDVNGLFTEKLLKVWDNGRFTGSLPQFHQAILPLMPSSQTPNYDEVGTGDAVFTASQPLTIVAGDTVVEPDPDKEEPEPVEDQAPTITGPDTYDRNSDEPPTFDVDQGSNRYYIVEFTSDPELFGNFDNRSDDNFYGSWADPSAPDRFMSSSYRLPQHAWDALKASDRLFYRVGSTSSQTDWDNYMVSTTDGDALTSAPFVMIEEGRGARPMPRTKGQEMSLEYQ
jgi:hypothetical protein